MNGQILQIPFQTDFIPSGQPVQMNRLVNGKLSAEAVHPPSPVVRHIQQMEGQPAENPRFSLRHLNVRDLNVSLLLNHSPHIRLRVRHIKVLVKRHLRNCLTFPAHLVQVSLY